MALRGVEGSPLLELRNQPAITSHSPQRTATFNQDDPSSLENYRVPAEAPPPYTPSAPESAKPEDVSGGYHTDPYAAVPSQAPEIQTSQPWQWHRPGKNRGCTRRKVFVILAIVIVLVAIVAGVLRATLGRRSTSDDSDSDTSPDTGPSNYSVMAGTSMTFIGEDTDGKPGMLWFNTINKPLNSELSTGPYVGPAYFVVGGRIAKYSNTSPLFDSGHNLAIAAAVVSEDDQWVYYTAYTDYDDILQVQSAIPSSDTNFDDVILSTRPTLSRWSKDSLAGMAAAPGTEYNNATSQWENGFSLVACASDRSVHEYTWTRNTTLADRFTWPRSVKCNLPTMVRHGSASFVMQRPDNTSDTITTWRRSNTGWDMGDKNFTVPHGNQYAACGEIFAFQDTDGSLKIANMTYPDSGAASFGTVSTVAATGAPNGTSIACKWKSNDDMRVYYLDGESLHYFEKKPGSTDWNKVDLNLNWSI